MMFRVNAAVAFLGLVCACALDSEDWVKPFIVMLLCGVWCAIAGIIAYLRQ